MAILLIVKNEKENYNYHENARNMKMFLTTINTFTFRHLANYVSVECLFTGSYL